MCQSPPLVDVASQIVGAEGPAGGGSRSSTLQAEMKHFDHEALGDEEEEPARNNVQNNPVMGEPTSARARLHATVQRRPV